MQANFVACITDGGAVFGKGVESVARDEPGSFDVVFGEELEEALGAYAAGPETAADVARGVFAAVRAEPAGDRVDVLWRR